MLARRLLGKTGVELSIIGFGGIVVSGVTPAEAADIVSEAITRGVNYFDVAPTYGNAEERLGPALAPYRGQVFLACKTTKRDAAGARAELENSLRMLRTDHFDLYQLHAMTTEKDMAEALGPGGALEAFVAAKDKGQVRYLGFSAHSADLAVRLLRAFPFDTVMLPINFVSWLQADFGPQVVAEARAKGVGVLALKGLARQRLQAGQSRPYAKCWYEPCTDPTEAELALRFTLSQDITAALPPGEAELFRRALDIAERFQPLTPAEVAELRRRAAALQPVFA
ncbi:MAG TPA: aldo/keto reductase [Firmicutes bacterium]|nr:aldo/keto reductase [Bacillota bacterium]